jgi:hypothetical protein
MVEIEGRVLDKNTIDNIVPDPDSKSVIPADPAVDGPLYGAIPEEGHTVRLQASIHSVVCTSFCPRSSCTALSPTLW